MVRLGILFLLTQASGSVVLDQERVLERPS